MFRWIQSVTATNGSLAHFMRLSHGSWCSGVRLWQIYPKNWFPPRCSRRRCRAASRVLRA